MASVIFFLGTGKLLFDPGIKHEHVEDIFLLTDKPVLYVANVDEKSVINGNKYVDQLKDGIKNENAEVPECPQGAKGGAGRIGDGLEGHSPR